MYCVGFPDCDSRVIVVPADRPRFDAMRRGLAGLDVWVLAVGAIDEKASSPNVADIKRVIDSSGVREHVRHRRLEMPLNTFSGFDEDFDDPVGGFTLRPGPGRAELWWDYFENGRVLTESMKRPPLLVRERLSLGAVQILASWKPLLLILLAIFAVSGLDVSGFSLQAAVERGRLAGLYIIASMLSGLIGVLFFMRWMPGKTVGVMGGASALLVAIALFVFTSFRGDVVELFALVSWSIAAGAFQAERLIGSTPLFSCRSLQGRSLPLQVFLAIAGALLWAWAGYVK